MILKSSGRFSAGLPEVFGARIENARTPPGRRPSENGDAFLVNLPRKLFAVADSPDWAPQASREFLEKINQEVERFYEQAPRLWSEGPDLESMKNLLTERFNRLMGQVDDRTSTAFSCLLVIYRRKGPLGLMLHSGDSCVFKIDLGRRTIAQVSWTNMHFVGRANQVSQVKFIKIDQHTRFVLCSDGLQVLCRNQDYGSLTKILLDCFTSQEIDRAPDHLIDYYGRDIDFPDDLTVLAFDPNRLAGLGEIILTGGDTVPCRPEISLS